MRLAPISASRPARSRSCPRSISASDQMPTVTAPRLSAKSSAGSCATMAPRRGRRFSHTSAASITSGSGSAVVFERHAAA